MIKLFIGGKGSGKTKTLIDMVNNAVSASNGNVICIEKGEKHPNGLVVAYKGVDPADLPVGLRSRQCLDAGSFTFLEDLRKHVLKITQSGRNTSKNSQKEVDNPVTIDPLHEHVFRDAVIPSTCVAKGYTVHVCDCGYEYRDAYTPLVDHQFKITDTVLPTCISDGMEEMVCEVCGEKNTVTIPAQGHKFAKWVEVKHPSCTEDGEERRRCARCGETETKGLPKVGHNFGGWTVASDGKRVKYCIHCGTSREDVPSETPIKDRRKRNKESIITLRDVLRNFGLYHKQYLTKRTTVMKKIEHLLGCTLTLAFALMCVIPTIVFYHNHPTGGEEIEIPVYWGAILFGNVILIIIAYILGFKEKRKYLAQGLSYPANVCSRVGMLITSRVLGVMSAYGFATIAAVDPAERLTGFMMGSIFAVWTILTALFAHCPREYKRIRFASGVDAIPKWLVSVMGVALTYVLLLIFGIVGGASEVTS